MRSGRRVQVQAVPGWPQAARDLVRELGGHPGRLALICGPQDARQTAALISEAANIPLVRVGQQWTAEDGVRDPTAVLSGTGCLLDLDILFWPELRIDPINALHALARRSVVLAVWPGTIERRWARYSVPGRRDYFEAELNDTIVLRPRPQRFPDQVPYEVERIPA